MHARHTRKHLKRQDIQENRLGNYEQVFEIKQITSTLVARLAFLFDGHLVPPGVNY